jgi:hypothetical protein
MGISNSCGAGVRKHRQCARAARRRIEHLSASLKIVIAHACETFISRLSFFFHASRARDTAAFVHSEVRITCNYT